MSALEDPPVPDLAAPADRPTKSSPFIEIKAGTENAPVFITHGLCGTARFGELARQIRTGNPIYGIQGKGVDGIEAPVERVEEMADYYLESLQALYPHGPYIFIGYSFGGLVALEMAQRLWGTPNQVPLLVLLDAYPHPSSYTRPVRMRLLVTRVKGHLKEMLQLSFSEAWSYFLKGLKRRLHFPGAYDELPLSPKLRSMGLSEAALREVKKKAYLALEAYRPKYYPGKIHFVSGEEKSFFPEDPRTVWGHLAADLQVESIPGNHLNIVSTEFEALAEVLTRYIQEMNGALQSAQSVSDQNLLWKIQLPDSSQ